MIGPQERRTISATATTTCVVLKIEVEELTRVLRAEAAFSDLFVQFVAYRSSRTQADLIDQLFNDGERRLARTPLLMADYGKSSDPVAKIPKVYPGDFDGYYWNNPFAGEFLHEPLQEARLRQLQRTDPDS